VVLIHGGGEIGDMWALLAAKLMADKTVVIPDLRGVGLSAQMNDGFRKFDQALDVASIVDCLDQRGTSAVRRRYPTHHQSPLAMWVLS
jgi:pimeloyl-ACP methyl ester carboxylesterase